MRNASVGNAYRRHMAPLTYLPALLLMMIFLASGCRDASTDSSELFGAGSLRFSLTLGDSLAFDSWLIDAYGYALPSTYARTIWRVTAVAETFAGRQGVTTVLISNAPGTQPVVRDTLRFIFTSGGEISEYGFLSRIAKRREGRTIPPAWDRIAMFSLPLNETWTVGVMDSLGQDQVQGRVLGNWTYFSAKVNGVETVFKGYTVVMYGAHFRGEISISSTPSAFLRFWEESTLSVNGSLFSLTAITTLLPGP